MKSKREALSTSRKKSQSLSKVIKPDNASSSTFSPKMSMANLEENIEIRVPTPFPQSQYMLIEDGSLASSHYTEILNEKYPPRKFVKHNYTSWLKCNKNKPKEISVKLLNPKINFEDYNLKKLTYRGENIDTQNVLCIEDAQNIIEMLKAKIIEYELTNNQNIETSLKYISNLKEENEFLKNKIVEGYEKINFINKIYDVDLDELYFDSRNMLMQLFKEKWAKKKAFNYLKNKTFECMKFKFNFTKYQMKRENILKLKSLLSLEKNYMIARYSDKIKVKRNIFLVKNVFGNLKYNSFISRLSKKFFQLKKTINKIIYLKELKINVENSKYYNAINKKGLFKYYVSLLSRALSALKGNTLKQKNCKIQNNKINFTNYFEQNKLMSNKCSKVNKVKAIQLLNKFLRKNIDYCKNKIVNHRNISLVRKNYFSQWKYIANRERAEMDCKILYKNKYMKKIIKKIKFNSTKNKLLSKNLLEISYKFFKQTVAKIIFLKKQIKKFTKQKKILNMRTTFDVLFRKICDEPNTQFVIIFFI